VSALAVARLEPAFSDWDGLLALILRAFAPMEGAIDPPSSAFRLTPESLRMKAGAETVFVARESSRLVGCLFAAGKGDALYLGKLAVEPARQRAGIGRALVAAAQAHALAEGRRALELQTRVELVGNQQAFARFGFTETARTAHPGFSRPTSITLRKELAA
jgi:predicted N-acetyltransferase YhbS